jgi:hypothetical protein
VTKGKRTVEEFVVARQQDTTLARRERLLRLHAKGRHIAPRADAAAILRSARCVRRILEQKQVVDVR